jgi:glutaminyl-tRNA synthetase
MEVNHFINTIIKEDIENKKHDFAITRFPPEPSGFLHLGHARAILTNYFMAKNHGGYFNLRFDDTNPVKEDALFVEKIIEDIKWLGCDIHEILYASDYFEEMYDRAMILVKKGLAFVDELTADEIKDYRGDLTTPGKESPYRNRPIEENIRLFESMKNGEFEDGAMVLRAKIDMASPNMNMRDPILYRIQRVYHQHRKDDWLIYPMYDFAHPIEDAIEGITHSLCSLEFEDHRPLYDWVVKHTEMPKVPRQIEFGKLIMANQVTGKRYIKRFVEDGIVSGWDDPRLITIAGLRRRGIPSESIQEFIASLGLPKSQGETEIDMLYQVVREQLKTTVPMVNAILDPIEVIITNYPEGESEVLIAENNRENESLGQKELSFSNRLYIERDDFLIEKPNKKWKRLSLGLEVRLMHAYFIKAVSVDLDENGQPIRIYATYDKETKSGSGFNDRKPNGTIHFVDAHDYKNAEFRIFEDLLLPKESSDQLYEERLNPESLSVFHGVIESSVDTTIGNRYQFTRNGYYCVDQDSTEKMPVFNRIVGLRSSFKIKA